MKTWIIAICTSVLIGMSMFASLPALACDDHDGSSRTVCDTLGDVTTCITSDD